MKYHDNAINDVYSKNFIIITGEYPIADEPIYTFVRQLACQIADLGIKCSVVAPLSITRCLVRNRKNRPYHWVDTTENGSIIDVYQPRMISLSNLKIFGYQLSSYISMSAVSRTVKKVLNEDSILYGHFWHNGIIAARIGKKKNLPVFVASGESSISIYDCFPGKYINQYLGAINGVICVSKKNLDESVYCGLTSTEKCSVIPNAIDRGIFYPEDKQTLRKHFGYGKDDFIVAFVGYFNERKGVLRLSNAIKTVGGIKSIFIGSGKQKPDCEGILYCGKLPYKEVVHYLNCADVFVLPTLAEGCCNAIIEAMACGLPIISSDSAFNDDILNDKCSIRVDPENCSEIANAIKTIKNDIALRQRMSEAAYETSTKLDIKERASRILEFIQKKLV